MIYDIRICCLYACVWVLLYVCVCALLGVRLCVRPQMTGEYDLLSSVVRQTEYLPGMSVLVCISVLCGCWGLSCVFVFRFLLPLCGVCFLVCAFLHAVRFMFVCVCFCLDFVIVWCYVFRVSVCVTYQSVH